MSAVKCIKFTYEEKDLMNNESGFDALLEKEWNEKMSLDVFRYDFSSPFKEKTIPGSLQFVVQFNPHRSTLRRKPQCMTHLQQPFRENEFHFGKINGQEILFEIHNRSRNVKDIKNHTIIINASPFEYCHSLLVPSLDLHLPQVLSKESILPAVEIMFLSKNPSIKLAFNSLCAYASVNHCHWHIYYLRNKTLYLETIRLEPLITGRVWTVPDYSAPAFVLTLTSPNEIEVVSKNLCMIIRLFLKNDIAHNVFMLRQKATGEVRIFIWAREKIVGNKNIQSHFVIAVSELSGYILIYDEETFDSITQEEIERAHQNITVASFESIKPEVLKLFSTTT